jgi:hypothetical protein
MPSKKLVHVSLENKVLGVNEAFVALINERGTLVFAIETPPVRDGEPPTYAFINETQAHALAAMLNVKP